MCPVHLAEKHYMKETEYQLCWNRWESHITRACGNTPVRPVRVLQKADSSTTTLYLTLIDTECWCDLT